MAAAARLELPFGVRVLAQDKPLIENYLMYDSGTSSYRPYNSVLEVNTENIVRHIGMTVLIFNGAEYKEYWYNGGTLDTDLIEKSSGAKILYFPTSADITALPTGVPDVLYISRDKDGSGVGGEIYMWDDINGTFNSIYATPSVRDTLQSVLDADNIANKSILLTNDDISGDGRVILTDSVNSNIINRISARQIYFDDGTDSAILKVGQLNLSTNFELTKEHIYSSILNIDTVQCDYFLLYPTSIPSSDVQVNVLFPSKSGTIALMEDISGAGGYVPLAGTTSLKPIYGDFILTDDQIFAVRRNNTNYGSSEKIEFNGDGIHLVNDSTANDYTINSMRVDRTSNAMISSYDDGSGNRFTAYVQTYAAAVILTYRDSTNLENRFEFSADTIFRNNQTPKTGIRYEGFGETDTNGTGASYSGLLGTSLVPKKYVDDSILTKVLTGFVVGTNSTILNTDTVLGAFQKTQGQINNRVSFGGDTVSSSMIIGTNNNFSLSFEVNNITRASISTLGAFSINNLIGGGSVVRLLGADGTTGTLLSSGTPTFTHSSLLFNIPNLNTAGASPSLNQFLSLLQSGLSFQWDGNNTVSAWNRLSLTTNVNATVGNSTTLGGTLFNLSSGIGTPSASTLDGLGFNIIGRAGFFQPFDVLSNGGKLRLGCGDIGNTNQILIGRYNSFVNANFNTYALENNLSFYFPFDNTIRIETAGTNRILIGNTQSASAKFYGDFDLINNRFNLIDSANTRTYFRYDIANRRLELGDFTNDSAPATTYQMKQFDSTGTSNLLGILYRDVNNQTKQALSVIRANRVPNTNGVPQTAQISYETRVVGLRTGYVKTLRIGNIATANDQVINIADNDEASFYTYEFIAGNNVINLPSASTCEGMKFRLLTSKTGGSISINRIGTDQILIGQSINGVGSVIATSYSIPLNNVIYEYEFEAYAANGYTINGAVQTGFLWKMKLLDQYTR